MVEEGRGVRPLGDWSADGFLNARLRFARCVGSTMGVARGMSSWRASWNSCRCSGRVRTRGHLPTAAAVVAERIHAGACCGHLEASNPSWLPRPVSDTRKQLGGVVRY